MTWQPRHREGERGYASSYSGLTMYDVESQRVLLDNIHGGFRCADAVEELKSPSRCRRLPADRDAAMLLG